MEYKNLERLKSVLQKEIDSGTVNGSAIRIIHENEVVYEEELGYADKEKGIPVAKDTIYRLFSMSKPITSAAAMLLYERGMLNLFAPVSDYLEGFVSYDWDSQYGYSYGNLMRIMVDTIKAASNGSIGEFGWDGYTGTYFFADPKEKLILIYMIQRCGGPNPSFTRKLRSIVYSAL